MNAAVCCWLRAWFDFDFEFFIAVDMFSAMGWLVVGCVWFGGAPLKQCFSCFLFDTGTGTGLCAINVIVVCT